MIQSFGIEYKVYRICIIYDYVNNLISQKIITTLIKKPKNY